MRKDYTIIVQTKAMKEETIDYNSFTNNIIVEDQPWKNYYSSPPQNIHSLNNIRPTIKSFFQSNSTNSLVYFYPASFYPYKNHERAVFSFIQASQAISRKIFLILTLSDDQFLKINSNANKSILNVGTITREEIDYIYLKSDYLFYPSLFESLGLPLLEAKQYNLPIISSELDFSLEISNPIYKFNPYSSSSMIDAILFSSDRKQG